jgi:hypothetical protein
VSTGAPGGALAAARYEVRLQGHLDERWSTWFDGLTLTHEADGTTTVRGDVVDQAGLHGLLGKVRDLGAVLVSVTAVEGPSVPAYGASSVAGRRPPA